MWCRIIYCVSIILATASVILLALFSPISHKNRLTNSPQLTLFFYVKQPQQQQNNGNAQPTTPHATNDAGSALIYHRVLTEGPYRDSRVVGWAQGFVIPIEGFDQSAFNIIYLTFDDRMSEYSGSVSVRAVEGLEKMDVVGGTGSFAFARGHAVFEETDRVSYRIKLFLNFSNRSSQVIPGS